MLADLGLTESDLQTHPALKATHECSGNHTGMLAACVRHGWDVPAYLAPEHPVQRACHAAVARAVGLDPREVPVAPDGCGVAAFATSVTLAATAYARLPRLVPRAATAMRAHPVLVEGEGLIDTAFMQAFPGSVSKDGAEGLGCAVLPDGRGLAVKALDGADRAMGPALIALAVRCLGLADVPALLAALARPPRLNVHGTQVGELVAVHAGLMASPPAGSATYHHAQRGSVLLFAVGGAGVVLLVAAVLLTRTATPAWPVLVVTGAILMAVAWLFSSMTVTVAAGSVRSRWRVAWCGAVGRWPTCELPGSCAPAGTTAGASTAGATTGSTTSRGSAPSQMDLADGARVSIGSDEPERLLQAILAARGAP